MPGHMQVTLNHLLCLSTQESCSLVSQWISNYINGKYRISGDQNYASKFPWQLITLIKVRNKVPTSYYEGISSNTNTMIKMLRC